MTYFWAPLALSFVWDGESEAVDVCHGGYGEPVAFRIPALVASGSPASILESFRRRCVEWMRDPLTWPQLVEAGAAGSVAAVVNALPVAT